MASLRRAFMTGSRLVKLVDVSAQNAPRMAVQFTQRRTFIEGHPVDYKKLESQLLKELEDPTLDGWKVRKTFQHMHNFDMVPEPTVIIAGLKACRRVNDLALAIRFLEAIKYKSGSEVKKIWPYVMQEITPTLKELGIPTLEEIGYDKPELDIKSVYED